MRNVYVKRIIVCVVTLALTVGSVFLRRALKMTMTAPVQGTTMAETKADSFDYTEKNGSIEITDFVGKETLVVIPKKIDDKPVTAIAPCAFKGETGIQRMILNEGLTEIGREAFGGCTGIKLLTIPKTVRLIADNAFSGCTGLTTINVNKDNTAYSSSGGVLYNKYQTELVVCPAAKAGDYTLSVNTVAIRGGAFEGCKGIKKLTVHDSVESIADNSFSGASSLKIVCHENSTAHVFAKEHGIPFELLNTLHNTSTLSRNTITGGQSATVNCSAEKGTEPYSYAVYLRKSGTQDWKSAQNYSENDRVTVTPRFTGTYEVRCIVKDGNGSVERKTMLLNVQRSLENTSTIFPSSVRTGELVTINCSASGGSEPYLYTVAYDMGEGTKKTVLQEKKENRQAAFRPDTAGKCRIFVIVYDDASSDELKLELNVSSRPEG